MWGERLNFCEMKLMRVLLCGVFLMGFCGAQEVKDDNRADVLFAVAVKDTLKAVLGKEDGIPKEQLDTVAGRFSTNLLNRGKVTLSAQEKAALLDGTLKVENFDQVLEGYKRLADTPAQVPFEEFVAYAQREGAKPVDQLVLLKLFPVFKSVEASQEFAKLTSITKVLTLKYVQYVAKNKKAPVTEKDLELEKELLFVDPATGEVMSWVFLAKKDQFKAPGSERVVVLMSPVPVNRLRFVGYADGGMETLKEEQVPKNLR